jgi:hypothetical protein
VINCPECGRENEDNAKICVYCGAMLTDVTKGYVATRALDDADFEEGVPKWGTARIGARMNLIISIPGTEKSFTFDINTVEELTLGRRDPDTSEFPEVDLTDFEALEKGVSRRHAEIIRKDGSLQILDNGSSNGTYLNGQKLVPHQARVLRDGDDVRLGHLVLRIKFERA